MRTMLIALLFVAALCGCSSGGDGPTDPQGPTLTLQTVQDLLLYTGEGSLEIVAVPSPALTCEVSTQLIQQVSGCRVTVSAPAAMPDGAYTVSMTVRYNGKSATVVKQVQVLRRRRPSGVVNNTSVELYGQVQSTVSEMVDVATCNVELVGDPIVASASVVPDKVTVSSDCSLITYDAGNAPAPKVRTIKACFSNPSPGSVQGCTQYNVTRIKPRTTQVVATGHVCYEGTTKIEWNFPEGVLVPSYGGELGTTVLLHDPNMVPSPPPGIVPTFVSRFKAVSVIGGAFPPGREPTHMVPTATNNTEHGWEATGAPVPTQPCSAAALQTLPNIQARTDLVETVPGVYQGALIMN